METTIREAIKFDRKDLSDETLIYLYKYLIKPRMIEEKMMSFLRQGKISKWFSGYGQEAISVGATLALKKDEYMLPMHRNLGIFTSRDIPLQKLFAQFQGKESGFTKGHDRSFHFGSKEHHIVGMISHLGPQLGIADGIALANKLSENKKATFVVTGDGGASEGDFHEAINTAAVWQLPVIIAVENNQWGLSTPSNEQFRCKQFIDKGIGYGIEAVQVDGNNILEVYNKVNEIAQSIRKNPRPVLMEFMTFRMRGHEEASGTKYYPEGLQDDWSKFDPIANYEEYLISKNIISETETEVWKKEIKDDVTQAFNAAYKEESIEANTQRELDYVYAPFNNAVITQPKSDTKTKKRFIDAISDGLRTAMRKHDKLVLMGQDIAEYGGVFKVTEGFVEEFGKGRVRNTPLCESAIIGSALGLSIAGYKGMMELQFADFVTVGFNQIVNNLAKLHYRWGEKADVVLRMPTGAGVGAGPFHSQSNEAWFFKVPGLKIVYPSSPNEAKGLLLQAFEDPNPVMFFEHKALYRSIEGEVNDDYFTIEIGKANIVNEGSDLTLITYGLGVHWALDYQKENPDVSIDLIDLRTLLPLDEKTIINSVKKTGRVVILHEDTLTGGIGAELSAIISDKCFNYLDAPIKRVASLDTPIPFAKNLEDDFLANKRLAETIKSVLEY